MNELIKIASGPIQITMTSLELVEFINSQRKEGEAELRHRDFTAKAPKVLGEEVCEKFRTPHINPQNGQTYNIYRFPKREACLMAMSYSYELQAKVFDRMTELEAAQTLPAIKDKTIAAIVAGLVEMDTLKQQQALLEAKTAEVVRRLDQIETAHDHFTVVGYGSLVHKSFPIKEASRIGKRATAICKEAGHATGEIPDPRFGKVKTYPKWAIERAVAEVEIEMEEALLA